MGRLGVIEILIVCTGNICRSPMAQALLGDRLRRLGVHAAVHSAGLVTQGQPASAHGVDAMAARGLDLAGHSSRLLQASMVERADLVLGMESRHVQETVVLVPEAFPRTFTLKELVRRGERHGARTPDQGLDDWLRAVHEARTPADLTDPSGADDVADPIGGPRSAYDRTAAEIEDLVDRLVAIAFPDGTAAHGATTDSTIDRTTDRSGPREGIQS